MTLLQPNILALVEGPENSTSNNQPHDPKTRHNRPRTPRLHQNLRLHVLAFD
jgi:hypothetical protein